MQLSRNLLNQPLWVKAVPQRLMPWLALLL